MTPIKTILQRTLAGALLLLSSIACAQNAVSDEKLQQLLAPIALYPDTVLTHILIASTYPLEVVQADRWAKKHQELSGEQAVNLADNEPWDPSVKALLAFPDLLARLSDDLPWTQTLGEAFLADEERTLDAVQVLRQQAWANGSLQDMEHQTVVREEKQIVIQPTRREVVYIPYYDTRVVYGAWRWSAYPPVYWAHPPRYRSGFYWGISAPVGDWFYFSGFYWPNRTVVINANRPYYYGSHQRYGYNQRNTRHWRQDNTHRRNVQPRRTWHSQPAARTISDRQREQVSRQLRNRNSRLNGAGQSRAAGSVKQRAQPERTIKRDANPTVRSAPAVRDTPKANNNTQTSRRVTPAVKRAPDNYNSAHSGSPRTIERRTAPRASSNRTSTQRHAPASRASRRE
ncbi:DUF3300 domain-containing protein [Gilvimarinus polysaccharolyticus]|uniref:DUF3300 domain-containing protein n=1 Tax=Gilvimarinus polysaccharolyticus TaxID=863921 RepID=UPI0006737131|nr:DUF3300 domain-containing protein [Gilvimarinus polysaccharolyticus]